mgnify:CR=1
MARLDKWRAIAHGLCAAALFSAYSATRFVPDMLSKWHVTSALVRNGRQALWALGWAHAGREDQAWVRTMHRDS